MKKIRDLVRVNVTSLNAMTKACLPAMVEKEKGAIINISSVMAKLPSPGLSAYGATKAYVTKFSMTLEQEYSEKGILIQTVQPGYVVTNMTGVQESFKAPLPTKFARSALSRLGIYSYTVGYWYHEYLAWLGNVLPEFLALPLVYKEISDERKRLHTKRHGRASELQTIK